MALRVLEGEIGHAERRLRHRKRRDFAMDQRRDPARGIHRRPAGRIGRIASQTPNPVYPRQDGQGCRQRQRRETSARRRILLSGVGRIARSSTQPWQTQAASRDTIMSNKMWGGRFGSGPDPIMEDINASIDFDRHLYRQDIAASKAHAAMLAKQGIITAQDAKRIAHGLDTILSEIEAGKFVVQARARRHPYECREPAGRADRAGRRAAAYRALAQRSGRDRFPALGARRHRRASTRRSPAISGRSPRRRSSMPTR